MCTITLIARRHGYALGMNRDEKLSRPKALPARRHSLADRKALFPQEPAGGTWMGVNDAGVGLALINWYAIDVPVPRHVVSRGEVVRAILSNESLDQTHRALTCLPLNRMSPFRLLGVFPAQRQVMEWRWNRRQLTRIPAPWRTNTWISSGYDEPGAQRTRSLVFRKALQQSSVGGLDWIQRLHRSHRPERGAYSTCMHRADAATVSFTLITVRPGQAILRYTPGPPCCTRSLPGIDLKLTGSMAA